MELSICTFLMRRDVGHLPVCKTDPCLRANSVVWTQFICPFIDEHTGGVQLGLAWMALRTDASPPRRGMAGSWAGKVDGFPVHGPHTCTPLPRLRIPRMLGTVESSQTC